MLPIRETESYVVLTDPETGKKSIEGVDFQYDDRFFEEVCDKHLSKEELGLDENGNPIIKTAASEGGTISQTVPVPMKATVTIYITPNSGYTIKDVVVDGKSVGPVNQYVFTEVDRGHSISASFASDQPTTTEAPPTTETPTEATTEAPTEAPTEATTEAPTETETPSEDGGGE